MYKQQGWSVRFSVFHFWRRACFRKHAEAYTPTVGGANDDVVSRRFSRPLHLASRRDVGVIARTIPAVALR